MKVMSYLDPIRETEVEEGEDLGHIQEKKKASSLTGLTPDAINDRIEQAVHTACSIRSLIASGVRPVKLDAFFFS